MTRLRIRVPGEGLFPILSMTTDEPETDAMRLERLARAAECERLIGAPDRTTIAWYLRRLAATPKALRALHSRRGRSKARSHAFRVALYYVASHELNGKGTSAMSDTCRCWGLTESAVNKILAQKTGWRRLASWELKRLKHAHGELSRAQLLRQVRIQLRAGK